MPSSIGQLFVARSSSASPLEVLQRGLSPEEWASLGLAEGIGKYRFVGSTRVLRRVCELLGQAVPAELEALPTENRQEAGPSVEGFELPPTAAPGGIGASRFRPVIVEPLRSLPHRAS
jgi:hypothetical protein